MAMNEITFGKNRYHEIGAMETWCLEHIGRGGYIDKPEFKWITKSAFGNTTFIFKDPKHYTFFVMKWL